MLVEAGAEVSPRERYHCNLPIIVAANVGDAVIFEMLLEGGADPGPYEDGPYVGYVSALDLALILGRLAIARQLFARGFDPNARSSVGTTALMTAAAHGHLDLVDALLEIGATVDAIDARGRTATIHAIAHNLEAFDDELVHPERHRAVIARLLEVGADPGHEDAERRSLVAWAELRGDPAIIALVRGAEPR